MFRHVRLPYANFPRNPFETITKTLE
jgi:hypothetical protein